MLQPAAGALLTPLQACSILSSAVAHINERPLVVHVAPDDMGVLTPWFLSARNMSTFHSQHVELEDNLEHPLSKRAFQAQQRLDLFKGLFNVYYYKEMVKFGHWNTQNKQPEVGDVCLILDKIKGKAHFLQRFQLGRIREFSSPHVCQIDFVKQSPEVTAALIRDLRSHSEDWRRSYKVKTSSCTRDLRSLAIVSAYSQEQTLRQGLDVDLLIDQPGPDVARVGDGGDHVRPGDEGGYVRLGGEQDGLPVQEADDGAVHALEDRNDDAPGVDGGVLLQPGADDDVQGGQAAEKQEEAQPQQELVPALSSGRAKRKRPLKERWIVKQ